ncbi:hypothetical protein EJB05_30325 [Eragrostis curvula]|uniref:Uncharacterized protein n=1 Tax=Eragrostis curvula TaxID=38414 RepID=A0A5J9UC13_9POAL|nr:hypothetical protein EJB05_30325 [Eragrostis curvula]
MTKPMRCCSAQAPTATASTSPCRSAPTRVYGLLCHLVSPMKDWMIRNTPQDYKAFTKTTKPSSRL